MFCPEVKDIAIQKEWSGFWRCSNGREEFLNLFTEDQQKYFVFLHRPWDPMKGKELKYGSVELGKVEFELGKTITRGKVIFYSQPKVYICSLKYIEPNWTKYGGSLEGYFRYLKRFDIKEYIENAHRIKRTLAYDRVYNVGEDLEDLGGAPWIYEQLCIAWTGNIEKEKQYNQRKGLTIPYLERMPLEYFMEDTSLTWGTREDKLCYLNPFNYERKHTGEIHRFSKQGIWKFI